MKASEKFRVFIKPVKLIEVYHTFKREPLKTFLKKDFSGASGRAIKTHLFILEKLGLIERVVAVYGFGKERKARKEVAGFRLKTR